MSLDDIGRVSHFDRCGETSTETCPSALLSFIFFQNLKIILKKQFEKIFAKLWEKLIKFCCTTQLNCRPKIIVYVSCIKFLGSCMYRYTRYTKTSCIVFRTLIFHSNSALHLFSLLFIIKYNDRPSSLKMHYIHYLLIIH